jgi:predicted TIM-barrel fold metal-dependent hydrolase
MLSVAATFILTAVSAASSPENDSAPPFEEILKIDIHAHIFDDMPEFAGMLKRTNMRVVNICLFGAKPEVLEPEEQQAEMLYQKYRPQLFFASTFDLTRRNEPDYANRVIAWLDKSFDAGALMTKIWKEVGMELKTPIGAYLMPDDPVFDPIYSHLAKLGKPLIAHLADPIDAWLPLDPKSAHYGYYAKNPGWYVHGRTGFPSHAQIMAARDNILVKHPDLTVIGCHLGSMDHDLSEVAKRLDQFPNFHVDMAARTYVMHRLPAATVRQFFVKYQDRILYGTDNEAFTKEGTPSKEEEAAFIRGAEAGYRADYLYYSGKGKQRFGNHEMECLGLPRVVLEKLYSKNGQRLLPALAQ